ncbi:MAG: rhomboid family intramembrane serine protease [Actinomycetota bacterium]|nr:rhomboid family intramembrane serine protease [Actinomycetota bacterium]
MTIILIVICCVVYFRVQQQPQPTDLIETPAGVVQVPSDLGFTLEYAAIPCEILRGNPLTFEEAFRTFNQGDVDACSDGQGIRLFPDKQVWLVVGLSLFLHGGIAHLLFNMWALWIFGNNVEDHLGRGKYLAFYLLGGVAATAAHVWANPDSTLPVVGASGAIAAVMGAYLVWFPNAPIRTSILIFIIRDIRARWFLLFWFVFQFFTADNSGVAWEAHVGGFVFGVVVGLVVRVSDAARRTIWSDTYRDRNPWGAAGGAGPDHRGPPFPDRDDQSGRW